MMTWAIPDSASAALLTAGARCTWIGGPCSDAKPRRTQAQGALMTKPLLRRLAMATSTICAASAVHRRIQRRHRRRRRPPPPRPAASGASSLSACASASTPSAGLPTREQNSTRCGAHACSVSRNDAGSAYRRSPRPREAVSPVRGGSDVASAFPHIAVTLSWVSPVAGSGDTSLGPSSWGRVSGVRGRPIRRTGRSRRWGR